MRYSITMSKRTGDRLKNPWFILGLIFLVCMVITCALAAVNTTMRIYHYHAVQSNSFMATAYLADNGYGKGEAHTGNPSRRSRMLEFNYTVYYHFQASDGQKIYATDQVADQDYSTKSRVGQTLKVAYDPMNPDRNYLDRSYYGTVAAYFLVLFYAAVAAFGVYITALNLRFREKNKNWPKSSLYVFWPLLALIVMGYVGAEL